MPVTNDYTLPIPYELTHHELVIEPHTSNSDADMELARLIEPFHEWNSDEIERVLRATVILKDANPRAGLGACLHTAMIWVRG